MTDLQHTPSTDRLPASARHPVGPPSNSEGVSWAVVRSKVFLAAVDAFGVLAAMSWVIAALHRWEGWGYHEMTAHLRLSLLSVVIWPVVFAQHRLYTARFVTRLFDEVRRVVHALAIGMIGVILLATGLRVELSRSWLLLSGVLSLAVVLACRMVLRYAFAHRRRTGFMTRRVVLVGSNVEALSLAEMLAADPELGYEVVAFVDDDQPAGFRIRGVPADQPIERVAEVARQHEAQGVIIAASALDFARSNRLVRDLTEEGFHVELTWPLWDIAANRLSVRPLGRFPVAYIEPVHRYGWRRVAKRTFDIVVAALALVMASPILVATALAVRLSSPGPVLFRQERVGQWGRLFKVLKFRTMVVDAEARLAELQRRNEADGPLFKMERDPRVTSVGRILRKCSIDELPQLWNVIRGEMSLVGPRPALASEMEMWGEDLHNRLRVAPGLTGMWQVHGRSNASFSEYERLDLYYVDNWSIVIDLAILLRTVPAVLFSRGAC